MKVEILPESPLISICEETNWGKINSFVLRAVRLKNEKDQSCFLESIQLGIFSGEALLKEIVYRGEALKRLVNKPYINRSGLQGLNAQMLLGKSLFWSLDYLQKELTLSPDQELGLLLEYVQVIDKSLPDRLEVLVEYTESSQNYSSTYAAKAECKIQQWTSANEYVFPLEGKWLITNTPLSFSHHRLGYSQEFAIDIIQLDSEQGFSKPNISKNVDYPGYGANVLAVADGVVVASVDGIPENPGPLNEKLSDAKKDELLKYFRQVDLMGGNHIIIQHEHEEYSYYAHLTPDSLTVSLGDHIVQGQVLGKLGNSGNSDAPHLHFHMMNGPDILTARGLPCVFENLKEVIMDQPVRDELSDNLLVYTS